MSVDEITVKGKKVTVALGPGITAADVDLNIESSATITIVTRDQARTLITSGLLDHDENGKLDNHLDFRFGGATYRLVRVAKQGDGFTLTAQDLAVAVLSNRVGQIKTSPGGSHIEFARRLVRDAGFDFVTPDKTKSLPNPKPAKAHKQAVTEADDRREQGFAPGANLTVKGAKASKSQKEIAATILSVAKKLGAGPKPTLAMMEAAIVENELSNSNVINDPGSTSVGVFQAQFGLSAGPRGTITREQALDVAYMAEAFLKDPGFTSKGGAISVAKKNPTMSAGIVAATVEGPLEKYRGRYDQVRDEAARWIAAYGGVTDPSNSSDSSPTGLTQGTTANPAEDTWTALKRIAEEKGYRLFAVRNRVHYIREQDLIRSRPRATLSEASPGVDWVDWEWMPKKKVNTTTVTCRASLWKAPPGSVIVLEDCGPASGRWLVSSFKRSVFSTSASIELRRGTELLKPAPVVKNDTTGSVSTTRDTTPGSTEAGATSATGARLTGTPKNIIDTVVIPIAKDCGVNVTPASVDAANATHGPTQGNSRSDHQGPPNVAWAADLGIGSDIRYGNQAGAAKGDKLAKALADRFDINWPGSGIANATHDGYRFQVIWRFDSAQAGNHYNHVHFGVRVA